MHRAVSTLWRWAHDAEHGRRVARLAETPLFAGLRKGLLGRLATRLFEKRYEAGEEIFHQGDPGRALFLVAEGRVEIVRAGDDGAERQLAVVAAPAVFGELALIDDEPRLATARALEPTALLILYRAHFEDLMVGDPAVAVPLCRNLLARLATYVRQRPLAAGEGAAAARREGT
jgi:CRP/FNR family transcriptional regulator, cyclic AMP receptor protein